MHNPQCRLFIVNRKIVYQKKNKKKKKVKPKSQFEKNIEAARLQALRAK